MSRFSHLEKIEKIGYDWESNLLKKTLPPRAFTNIVTANFMLGIEKILGESYSNSRAIRRYFRL